MIAADRAAPSRALPALLVLLACACGDGRDPAGSRDLPAADAGSGPSAPDVDLILQAGCATATERGSLLASNMLFVVDRSQSMACNPPPLTDSVACEASPRRSSEQEPNKWEITRSALVDTIAQLPEDTRVGLSFFSNDASCGVQALPSVEIAPLGGAQREAIRASLDAVEPVGGTPVVGATILAYRHLHQRALEGLVRGNKFVVLLTDGEQSDACVDPGRCEDADACTQLLVDEEVPKAAAEGVGIRTFVIGAPGSEPARVALSLIAERGGTATPGCDPAKGDCHFDMTQGGDFAPALAAALERIGVAATPCEIGMPSPSGDDEVDPALVNVIYSPGDASEPRLVPQVAAGACGGDVGGWRYDETGTRIVLCGEVCEDVRVDVAGRVDVVLGCKTEGPQ